MPPRRTQPQETAPDFPPQKAYLVLSTQLEKLQSLKGKNYQESEAAEEEWYHLTEKLVMRSFGSGSPNYRNFRFARSAGSSYIVPAFGDYGGVDHRLYQSNFEARLQAYESALRSSIEELRLDLPEAEFKGIYEPGQEYELYQDVKAILELAKQELFVIDPYLSGEIFDVYAGAIPRSVRFRLLGAIVPPDVQALGLKYASGGNFEFRSSNSIHDRVIFADKRVWVCGQSLKDAAKKKATYIVETDETLMRPVYDAVWASSQKLV